MILKLLKLPMLTLAAGIILRIADFVAAMVLAAGTSEWTAEMGDIVFYVRLILSAAAFVTIGMLLRKNTGGKTLALSATLIVLYYVIVFAAEQITQLNGQYSIIVYWLFIPVEMFTVITSVLARLSSGAINWVYVIPSILSPYLFLLFCRKKNYND